LAGTAAAQVTIERTPVPHAPISHARVQHLLARGSGESMEVEIQISGEQVAPDTQAITGPDRIVIDFPGALPAAELRALTVNRGVLKAVRSGLFFSNPPITRIVLDLTEPQSYQISTLKNAVLVKLRPVSAADKQVASATPRAGSRLREASLTSNENVPALRLSDTSASTRLTSNAGVVAANSSIASVENPVMPATPLPTPQPVKPAVNVSYENGMLRIHADKVTLAQVLFEVHQHTQAEIAIPAGAEQEQVIADLGPAPARDVLAALLNGSSYNFIFVGNELALERVILTRRDSSNF
jgi:hypothetical protein